MTALENNIINMNSSILSHTAQAQFFFRRQEFEAHRLGIEGVVVGCGLIVITDDISEHKLTVNKSKKDSVLFLCTVTVDIKPLAFGGGGIISLRRRAEEHIVNDSIIEILLRSIVMHIRPNYPKIPDIARYRILPADDINVIRSEVLLKQNLAHQGSGDTLDIKELIVKPIARLAIKQGK